MKLILGIILLLTATSSFADESDRIKILEQRIRALEAQNGSSATSGGLKVKDLGGQKIQTQRAPSSGSAPSMTAAQQAEIMKKLGAFKERRQEEVNLLEEMEAEGY